METLEQLTDRAIAAHVRLAELGEEVEDEWSYIQDLSSTWQERLASHARARADDAATDAQVAAIDRLIDEVGRITDPHRAIDWLSTFPQVALLALGADPDEPGADR